MLRHDVTKGIFVNHLSRRKGSTNLYYREAVPADVRELLLRRGASVKREVWKSLGTADLRSASSILARVRAEQHEQWDSIRSSAVTSSDFPSSLDLAEAVIEHIHDEFVEIHRRILQAKLSEGLDFGVEALQRKAKIVQVDLLPDEHDQAKMEALAAGLCKKLGWPLGPGETTAPATWSELLTMVTKAVQHARHLVVETLEGRPADIDRARIIDRLGVMPFASAKLGQQMLDLFDRYETEKWRVGDKKSDTVATERKVIEHLALFVGKKRDVSSIASEDIREFKEALSIVPTRWTARPELAGLLLVDAAAKWRATGKGGRSSTTVRRELSAVSTFFRWLKKNAFHPGPNPTTDLFPPVSKKKNKLPPYTEDQLKAVFSSPLFHECDPKKPYLSGSSRIRDWRYWLPLCALFSGGRAGEISQLMVADITCEEGTWTFDLNDNPEDEDGPQDESDAAKSLKTESSRRQVPVHPALIELGILEYLEMCRKAGETRLFPEIRPGPRGNLSHYPSKFWQGYLKRIGIKRKGLALHSFRHTFVDECRRKGVSKDVLQGLLGHSDGSQTGHYGREQPGNPAQRREAVYSLSFFGLAAGLPAAE